MALVEDMWGQSSIALEKRRQRLQSPGMRGSLPGSASERDI